MGTPAVARVVTAAQEVPSRRRVLASPVIDSRVNGCNRHPVVVKAIATRQICRLLGAVLCGLVPSEWALAEPKLTVVELFSSQGCSSCQAADANLLELARRDDVLALNFHVDYWDFAGWIDPYADPAYTRRQQAYANRFGQPYLVSPQTVINGKFHTPGTDTGRLNSLVATARNDTGSRINVQLTRAGSRNVRLRIDDNSCCGVAEVLLVRYDAEHATRVADGENSGRTLKTFNVVRQLAAITVWQGEALDLTIPLQDLAGAGEDVVAVRRRPKDAYLAPLPWTCGAIRPTNGLCSSNHAPRARHVPL